MPPNAPLGARFHFREHLLAGTPCAQWLEYVDWTDAIAADPVKIADGLWPIPDRPGTGLAWDASAVEKHRIR